LYIKDNYKKLGFTSLSGPYEIGYDFRGIYEGKPVVVEAERLPKNFVEHKHNPKEVDILITLWEDDADRSLLPQKIIKVDAEDFVKYTYEMRRAYAVKMKEKREEIDRILPSLAVWQRIKNAFATLYALLIDDTARGTGLEINYWTGEIQKIIETPEEEAFNEALETVVSQYVDLYNIDLKECWEKPVFTEIEILANDLRESRRNFEDLTPKERKFLIYWLNLLREEYSSRL